MPLLKKGNKIGLVATSNPICAGLKKSLNKVIKLFIDFGLIPVLGKHCFVEQKKVNMLISPQLRAEDFNRFIEDKEIKAIINLWGGHNSNDLLDLISWNKLKNNEKIIIGASDFTTILNAVYARLKQTSYHWINALWYGLKRYKESIDSFKRYFLENDVDNNLFFLCQPKVVKEGEGKGVLIGGNLESLERLIGTRFYPCFNRESYILFLEDINRSFLNIRATLQHLRLGGFFEKCHGLILGHFTPVLQEKNIALDLAIQSLVKKAFSEYDFPIIYSPNIGHEVPNEVLPIGDSVYIDTRKKEFLYIGGT